MTQPTNTPMVEMTREELEKSLSVISHLAAMSRAEAAEKELDSLAKSIGGAEAATARIGQAVATVRAEVADYDRDQWKFRAEAAEKRAGEWVRLAVVLVEVVDDMEKGIELGDRDTAFKSELRVLGRKFHAALSAYAGAKEGK